MECSKTCGIGRQLSSRKFDQPSSHGGTECEGNATKSKECHEGPCPGAYIPYAYLLIAIYEYLKFIISDLVFKLIVCGPISEDGRLVQ